MLKDINIDEILRELPHMAESASEEVRTLVKAALGRALQDMDLAYQEEIDILKEMLNRTEARVSDLEQRLGETD